jgi:chromosome segregation ATPase
MKYITLLLAFLTCLVLFTGCGGDSGSESSDPAHDQSHAHPEGDQDRMRLDTEFREFMQTHDLSEHPVVESAKEKLQKAVADFNRARQEHPELAPLIEQSEQLWKQAVEKKQAGEEEAYAQLTEAYADIRRQVEGKAEELPELQEMLAEVRQVEREVNLSIAEVVAGVNERGEELAKQLQSYLDTRNESE